MVDVELVAAGGGDRPREGACVEDVPLASGFDGLSGSVVDVTPAPTPWRRARNRYKAGYSDLVAGCAVRTQGLEKRAPVLAEGVELLGEYRDSGYLEPRYLARRADGQMIQLPRPVFVVAESIDGQCDAQALAERASAALGRRLSEDAVRFLIDEKLRPIGLVDREGREEEPLPRASPLMAIAARHTLVPARWVNKVSATLTWLFAPGAVSVALITFAAAWAWFLLTGGVHGAAGVLAHPAMILAVLGLVWASAVVHEFGHASACRRGGGHPGRIGFGVYIVWPALFTNVTDSYRLSRGGRVRTDLGGVYFSALSVVALIVGYATTGFPALAAGSVLVTYAALIQLLPVGRLDGYFLVGDLLGIPDPKAHIRPTMAALLRRGRNDSALRPRVRMAAGVWLGLTLPCVTAFLLMLLVNFPHLASTSFEAMTRGTTALEAAVRAGDLVATGLYAVMIFTLLLPPLGMTVLLVRVVTRLARVARRSSQGRPLRLAAYTAAAAGFVSLVVFMGR